jgi:hypothetical protein
VSDVNSALMGAEDLVPVALEMARCIMFGEFLPTADELRERCDIKPNTTAGHIRALIEMAGQSLADGRSRPTLGTFGSSATPMTRETRLV